MSENAIYLYVNIYATLESSLHISREDADYYASEQNRKSCVKIKYEEGRFDE
jgi:hypothetical protein